MNPLDQLLKDHVTPVLIAHGFAKAGRIYRAEAATGDLAYVAFKRWETGDHMDVVVNLSVLPTTQWAWLCHDQPKTATRKPGPGDGLWQGHVPPPAPYAADEWTTELWRVTDLDQVGAVLARTLAEDTVPMLLRMLDRAEFLRMIQAPDTTLKPGLGHGEVMLLVDEGPSAALDQALAWYEARDPEEWPAAHELAHWARQRAAEHGKSQPTM